MKVDIDNPVLPCPQIVIDEINARRESLYATHHDIGAAGWEELAAILRVDHSTLRNLGTGRRRKVTSKKLDVLVVALGLIGYVDVTTGRQLYTAGRRGAAA